MPVRRRAARQPALPSAPTAIEALSQAAFADRLDRLGPFERHPRLAIAVSGGGDSMALAMLADGWAARRQGSVLALIVDHGLREAAADEAALTRRRLAQCGIESVLLRLHLQRGPALAARARVARLDCLVEQARRQGIPHLLLGHHAGDQAETWMMRSRAASGPAGLAGIATLREIRDVRLLRPLLDVPRCRLQAVLRELGVAWVEDPSNQDLRTQRGSLRAELDDPRGDAATTLKLLAFTQRAGPRRTILERTIAAELAERATISPLGYAVISPGPISVAALSAVWRAVSGRAYPPASDAMQRLAARMEPATLDGLRMLPAGRLGPGWLLVRESRASPVPARHGARWDRFLLHAPDIPGGLSIGPAPAEPAHRSALPASVRRVLPALWQGEKLYQPLRESPGGVCFRFAPANPAADAAWFA